MTGLYIGVMTGTSLDGIDVVISKAPEFKQAIASQQIPLSDSLKNQLSTISKIDFVPNCLAQIKQIEQEYTQEVATAVAQTLQLANLAAHEIVAIGVHGVTVCHLPEGDSGFTWQLIDAHRLAAQTGIDVVYDFRSKDVGLGGQGAPLVPPFHQYLFGSIGDDVAVLNLGGIANVTSWRNEELIGFDTGPANTLMDVWYAQNQKGAYDQNGEWAASGDLLPELLNVQLADPYFAKAFPKSTGKEHFNLTWLNQAIEVAERVSAKPMPMSKSMSKFRPNDVQCTLAHLTAKSVAQAVTKMGEFKTLAVCGGGVHNKFLMSLLAKYLPETEVVSSLNFGVCPDSLEALAFAWLAYCRCEQKPSSAPSVTGAKRSAVLGAWVKAH